MIFPAKTNNFNVESLRGHAVTKSLRDTINEIQNKIGKRMYEVCLRSVFTLKKKCFIYLTGLINDSCLIRKLNNIGDNLLKCIECF